MPDPGFSGSTRRILAFGLISALAAASAVVGPRATIVDGWLFAVALGAASALLALGASPTATRGHLFTRLGLAFLTFGAARSLGLYRTYFRDGGLVAADALRAVGQTDLREALQFLGASSSSRALVVPALASIAAWWASGAPLPSGPGNRALRWRTRRVTIGLVVLCAIALGFGGLVPVLDLVDQARTYRREAASFALQAKVDRTAVPAGVESDFRGSVMLVLGESTARAHMGLYGYLRDTTPRLAARAAELVTFRDVISSHSSTAPSLGTALFDVDQDASFEFLPRDAIDLVSLARGAGFVTRWFSNQNEFGVWENPITALARRANEVRFFSSALGRVYRPTTYDEEMLPAVAAALRADSGDRKLIVVHLFADHWNYCANHPAAWRFFRQGLGRAFWGNAERNRELDCYDDGVRYVDFLVDELIRIAGESPEPRAVVFLSDHGEAPLFDTKHDSAFHSSYQIEVPLLLWANRAFRAAWPAKLDQAELHRDRPYSLARIFHSLADLMAIRYTGLRPEESLFSERLVDRDRMALGGRISYDRWSNGNDYRENSRIAGRALGAVRSRVWAHRVDSLGVLMEAKPIFAGVEVDLVFEEESGRFEVRHPPVAATGLTLERMLEAATDRPDLRFWLDWKNVSEENLDAALGRLLDLDRRFHLRERTLVETASEATFPRLEAIAEAGFEHGYYLPTESVLGCPADDAEGCLDRLAESVRSAAITSGATALTFDWRLKPFVDSRLAAWIERQGLKQYAWDTHLTISAGPETWAEIRERLLDGRLAALLVGFPSAFRI